MNQHFDFLPEDLHQRVLQYFEDSKNSHSWIFNNLGVWGQGLNHGSVGSVGVLDLGDLKYEILDHFVTVDSLFKNIDYEKTSAFLHMWLPGSHINFHTDHDERTETIASATIYLNDWNWNWGGLFLYEDDTGSHWIFPHRNKLVWFKPPIWHSVSMITQAAEWPRLSIQIFFKGRD